MGVRGETHAHRNKHADRPSSKKHFLLIAIVHANFETTVTIRTIKLNSIGPEKTWMACMGLDTDGA